MKYNFDKPIDRKNTRSYKWDRNMQSFGREDLIPLWVADMDFPCAEPIVQALVQRAQHPIYGYTVREDSAVNAFLSWMQKRHNCTLDKSWITFSPPGIIYAIHQLIQIITQPGDGIVLQTPNYGPLLDLVTGNGRKLLSNPMKLTDQGYVVDIEGFEALAKQGAKALILSNPNNPTGHVYTKEELMSLCNLSKEHGLWVISDDIYADFSLGDSAYTSVTNLSPEFNRISVSCYSSNKSFNLGGLQMGTIVIPNEALKEKYDKAMELAQTRLDSVFGTIAMEAAYTACEDWMNQVVKYIEDNAKFVYDFTRKNIPKIRPVMPQGTFLMWMDCRELEMDSSDLEQFLIHKAGLAVSQGYEFSEEGKGFIRVNLACSRTLLSKAMDQLSNAVSLFSA